MYLCLKIALNRPTSARTRGKWYLYLKIALNHLKFSYLRYRLDPLSFQVDGGRKKIYKTSHLEGRNTQNRRRI